MEGVCKGSNRGPVLILISAMCVLWNGGSGFRSEPLGFETTELDVPHTSWEGWKYWRLYCLFEVDKRGDCGVGFGGDGMC